MKLIFRQGMLLDLWMFGHVIRKEIINLDEYDARINEYTQEAFNMNLKLDSMFMPITLCNKFIENKVRL